MRRSLATCQSAFGPAQIGLIDAPKAREQVIFAARTAELELKSKPLTELPYQKNVNSALSDMAADKPRAVSSRRPNRPTCTVKRARR